MSEELRDRGTRVCASLLFACVASCGYAPMVVDRNREQRFCVMGSTSEVADSIASAALEVGVRQELSRRGALGACPGGRVVRVSLQRVFSVPEGIVASDGRPVGRGVRITAEALATMEDASQELRAEGEAIVGSTADATREAQVQSDGRALASKEAGARLARKLLGEPLSGPGMGP